MNTNHNNRMKTVADEYYNKLSSQKSNQNSTLHDKGEATLPGAEQQTKAPTAPFRLDGGSYGNSFFGADSTINQILQKAYSRLYPNDKNEGLIGSVDEKEIKDNIPLAESVIEKNLSSQPLNREIFKNLPYLKPGLATFYAAAFSGNHKAANAARKLAYTEDDGYNFSLAPESAQSKPKDAAASNKRYVNADIGLNVRESPGTRSRIIGSLSYNHEVEFTGNKVGETEDNMWAEIKYGDKTGWVKAMFLNTERPYGADNSKVAEASKDEKASAQASSEAPKNDGARRYIGKNEVFLYESPTMASDVLRSGHLGEEVTFLGEKKKTNGFEWAKVSYKGKIGWVRADFLKLERPYGADNSKAVKASKDIGSGQEKTENKDDLKNVRFVGKDGIVLRSNPHFRSTSLEVLNSGDIVHFTGKKTKSFNQMWAQIEYNGKTGWVKANDLRMETMQDLPKTDLTDHDSFQNAFDEITDGFTADRLQCVFLTKWFLENYTTLKTGNGDGFIQVEATKTANPDKNLQESIIPSAPAIYSMDKGKPGFGMRDITSRSSGHTGVILSVKSNNESENPLECTYDIVFFDTYSDLYDDKHRSRLRVEHGVKPVEHITYLNIGKYLK